MSAFFFGPRERQLYGFHHAPAVDRRGRAVVICPPWGPGYEYAHRALVVLAKRLTEDGRHVLRFDYSGTGDSWGETTDADLDRWVRETEQAMEEIRALSGCRPVDLVGLRLGAFIAARVAARTADDCRVVLWDPVVDGRACVAELKPRRCEGNRVEAAGTVVTSGFLAKLQRISAWDYPSRPGRRALLLMTQKGEEGYAAEQLPGLATADRLRLDQPAPWLLDPIMWTGQVPALALMRIVEWLD